MFAQCAPGSIHSPGNIRPAQNLAIILLVKNSCVRQFGKGSCGGMARSS
jgi:hypothetical protein